MKINRIKGIRKLDCVFRSRVKMFKKVMMMKLKRRMALEKNKNRKFKNKRLLFTPKTKKS